MNLVILSGRLTRDPEAGTYQNLETSKFSIAVDRIGAKDGQQDVDFFTVNCIGTSAAFVNKYVKKGYKLTVEGEVRTYVSEKEGKKNTFFSIRANRVHDPIAPRSSAAYQHTAQQAPAPQYAAPQAPAPQAPAPQYAAPAPQAPAPQGYVAPPPVAPPPPMATPMDNDIPF